MKSNIEVLYQMVRERAKELDIKILSGEITKNTPVDVNFSYMVVGRAPVPGISIQKIKYRGKVRACAAKYFLLKKGAEICGEQK